MMTASGLRSTRHPLRVGLLLLLTLTGTARAKGGEISCADSLDPLLGSLAGWLEDSSPLAYGYTAVACGAVLAVGFKPGLGYHLPPSQRLLWPGNLCGLDDSSYVPKLPEKLSEAREMLLAAVRTGRGALIVTPFPVFVYAADTSFGDPWFLVSRCNAGKPDTSMWDTGDLTDQWWLWDDDPGANLIWLRPERLNRAHGRSAMLAALRNCVLAVRPKTVGATATGLAAFDAAQQASSPGSALELTRIAAIRLEASKFLVSQLDLWPPAEREPLKLAAYYLQKSAGAWTELSARAADWAMLSAERREELLSTVQSHETSAAVALDGIVSKVQE